MGCAESFAAQPTNFVPEVTMAAAGTVEGTWICGKEYQATDGERV
jgi:UDP-glucose 4-epimerase